MKAATQRRLFAVAALAVAGSALGMVSYSDMGEDLVYYWSPTELRANANAKGATVRLGGLVVPGTLQWNRDEGSATFDVSDGATTVRVRLTTNPPQMFREGIGVVVEGKLAADGAFDTQRVMVKHSNEYQAPEGGHPPDVARTLVVDPS